MSGYLESITPDSLSGIIFALEGVRGSVVLLNGPTGCKFYHSAISDNQVLRQLEFDPLNFPAKWYFGQPRVPCTYLDSGDYVYGGREKLTEALEYIRENVPHSLLCVVNSPGAALIGDDLDGIARIVGGGVPVVTVETPGFSSDVCAGFETGALALLRAIDPPKMRPIPKTVNLLGVSIFQKYFAGDLIELRRILALCGVEVHCALCADSDVDAVRAISSAALNIVVRPEYGTETARYLEREYTTPCYVCDGAPIGFAATEKLVRDVGALLDCDVSAAIEDCERARATAFSYMSRVNLLTGLPKGVHVSVEGTYSDLLGYFRFFAEYFAMVPECGAVICPRADELRPALEAYLAARGLGDVLSRDILEAESELVFASGATISRVRLAGRRFVGVENAQPTLGYLDVIPKTHLGVSGALLIVEQTLNGLL
jgi:nitrogenase molybdenum-iron protein alpha/beta subunit